MAKPTPRTAERQALADAIELHSKATRAVAVLAETINSTHDRGWDARRAATAADEVAAGAKAEMAQHALASALGRAGPAPLTPADARAAAAAAHAEVAALRETLEGLEALTSERESAKNWKLHHVRDRVTDAIRAEPGLAKMVTKFAAVAAEFAAQRQALEFLKGRGVLPAEPRYSSNDPSAPDGDAAWRAAFAALESNPDFVLPT